MKKIILSIIITMVGLMSQAEALVTSVRPVYDDSSIVASQLSKQVFPAIRSGNLDDLKKIIIQCSNDGKRFDVEVEDDRGWTPISYAAEKGYLEIVKYLYETWHADIKRILIDFVKSAEVKAYLICETKKNKELSIAIQNKDLETIQRLCETCHANVNAKNDYGWTPINYAVWYGHLEVVKYLYETYHADVEVKDKHGMTPINNAAFSGHLEIVKYLYETYHANVETKNNNGDTPINAACDYLDVVKYLYETCNVNVETKDKSGKTPLNNASSEGWLEIVQYLCEKCHADVETKDNYGRTPIDNASRHDDEIHLEVVGYLRPIRHANLTKKMISHSDLNQKAVKPLTINHEQTKKRKVKITIEKRKK